MSERKQSGPGFVVLRHVRDDTWEWRISLDWKHPSP